jgi:anti-anti-sigma regulatory factor
MRLANDSARQQQEAGASSSFAKVWAADHTQVVRQPCEAVPLAMNRLFEAAGISDESIQQARAVMGRQMRSEGDAFIDEAVRRTLELPGYQHLEFATLRPNTARSMLAIRDTLEGGDIRLFGAQLYDIAYARAKSGLPPRSLYDLANITEALLIELSERCLAGTQELLSAAIVARRIAEGAREVIVEGFQAAHVETRAAVERLASQFSAPILPALPGVLVLPIVGAITPARADHIIDALLRGIDQYTARTAILDITGITDVDASLPSHLQRAIATARLVGARVVLVGVNPEVARALVSGDVDLRGVNVLPTLAAALLAASAPRRSHADAPRLP